MTAIASFALKGCPFLISDVLISVKVGPTDPRARRLPEPIKRFNAHLPADSEYSISDVLQKTVTICDGFILAYSGTVSHAERLIRHLRKVTKSRAPSGELFGNELQVLEAAGQLQDLSLLAITREGDRFSYRAHNARYFRHRKFRFLRAAGSGGPDLLDAFAAYRGIYTNRVLNGVEEGLRDCKEITD